MSCHELVETARACDYLVWANRWLDSRTRPQQLTADQREEVAALRAEAEEVLGAKTKQDTK